MGKRYLKDGLHSPSDIFMGFDTHDLPCSQDPVQQFPSKNIMNCDCYVVCVCPFFCPKVSCHSTVWALKE